MQKMLLIIVCAAEQIVFSEAVKCRQCFDADDPRDCSNEVDCGQGEICYTKLFRDLAGNERYHLGCEDNQICSLLNHPELIGRRDSKSISNCHRCCKSASCNAQLCTATVPKYNIIGNARWRDCGNANSWVTVRGFNISPSPVKLPGLLTVSLDLTVRRLLSNNSFTFDVLMEREEAGVFRKIPCNVDVGSCHHRNPCSILAFFARSGLCSLTSHKGGIPCTCPFPQGRLSVPPTSLNISRVLDAWNFLITGNYHLKLSVKDITTGQEKGCFQLYLALDVANQTMH